MRRFDRGVPLLALVAVAAIGSAQGAPAIAVAPFGKLDDTPVQLYTLTNSRGLVARITNFGAIVTELHVPDRAGTLADIVLGFEELDSYVKGHPYFGAIVGRVANRIGNAGFTLGGTRYGLEANDRPHHLHGGRKGWDKVVWSARPLETPAGPALELTYVSKDGEEGYPGTVAARTVYTLTNDNELIVEMQATTDRTTLVNMAHHSYWNLGGHDSGTILNHALTLYADRYTPGTPMVPDGRIRPATLGALDRFLELRGKPAGETVMIHALDALQGERYIRLAERRPANEAFLYGWLANRIGDQT